MVPKMFALLKSVHCFEFSRFQVALGNVKEDVDSNIEVDLVHSEFNSLHIHRRTVPDHDWDVAVPYGKPNG